MKPKAIIVDIDGTLAHNTGRGWYDFDQVHTDRADEIIREICHRYKNDHTILIVTGRDEVCRDMTDKWLKDNDIPFDELHMRPLKDKRKDTIVKAEIFNREIRYVYDVKFVLDDLIPVVAMWRELGLKCLQVEPGLPE